jgi:NAD(P)-dependent dehydrogenase (short-subunit alcohol dehydrogenase family)
MSVFQSVIDINTMGTVIPCFVFGRSMAKARRGSIINFASMTSYRPITRVAAYSIAKVGIVNFTQWLAAYLAPANIRVNGIAPGFFLNDRSRKLLLKEGGGYTERGENFILQTTMRKMGEAPDLLGCMNWLIDNDDAVFVTGITIPFDSGFLSYSGV